MSLFLLKVLWYQLDERNTSALGDNVYRNPVDITDAIEMTASKGLEIKNNIVTLPLKNSWQEYIDEENNIEFEEQDQIKIYVKYTTDGGDISTGEWTNYSSSELLGVFYVIEYQPVHSETSTRIQLKCADKAYILFNKVFANVYTQSDGMSAPQIIQDVIRKSCENQYGKYSGSGSNPNVRYDIDTRLVSEGGQITSTRSDSSAFPTVVLSKIWKPLN